MTREVDIKVLLVSPIPPPYGGISHWTRVVTQYASRTTGSPAIRVLDTAPGARIALPRSLVHRLLHGILRFSADCSRLTWELTFRRPDVVHLTTSGDLALVRDVAMLIAAKAFKIPVVYHIRLGRLPILAAKKGLEWRWALCAVKLASVTLVLDDATERCLRAEVGHQRLVQLPNPVVTEHFVDCADLEDRRNVVLFVGWVIAAKGVTELLEAWRRLAPTDWTLEVVGPIGSAYVRAARRLPELGSVRFVGELSHTGVLEKMRTSRVFVLPSHTEGFPNVIAEAMASAMVVVATSVGAIESMLSGAAGIVVPPHDVEQLVTALELALFSPQETSTMAVRARQKAMSEFAIERVFDRYVDLWRSLACVSAA